MIIILAFAPLLVSASYVRSGAQHHRELATCPQGSIPDISNENCCPEYCGRCGGEGCHHLPGGEYECCPSTFKYTCHDDVAPCKLVDTKPDEYHDASVCPEHSIMNKSGEYCCPEYCGHCGGNGCHLLPGGEFNCCWSTFKYSCFDGVAPCILDVPEEPIDLEEEELICPKDSIPDAHNKNCCPYYCEQCGGAGCHLFPGGEFECCPSTFKYTCYDEVAPCILVKEEDEVYHDPSVCPEHSIMNHSGEYCCPEYCGRCGGNGCHLLPGGEFNCCWSTFKYSCANGIAPCILDFGDSSNDDHEHHNH